MATRTTTTDKKAAYKDKLNAEFKIWSAKLAELRAREKRAEADARIEYLKRIEEMEGWTENLRSRIKAISEKTEETWDQYKSETDDFMNRMKNRFSNWK